MKTLGRWGLLSSLYFSQGLPFGFFVQALPVLLRERGSSLTEVGLLSFLALPWGLKALWAPLVDQKFSKKWGRRRSWILPLQLGTACILGGLAWLGENVELKILLVVVAILNLMAATQDIATDGLAVEMLEAEERGVANGIQVAGYRMGMIVGGGVLLVLHEEIGAVWTFASMGSLILVATIPVYLMKESTGWNAPNETVSPKAHFSREPGAWKMLLVLFVFKAGDALGSSMLRPYLVDLGLGRGEIGKIIGTVSFIAGLLGALVGGALVNRLGRKNSLLVFGSLQALSIGSLIGLSVQVPTLTQIYWVSGLEHFAGGLATAALFTCMMDFSRKEAAGSDYTTQASVVVISTGLFSGLAGVSADAFGYTTHFMLSFGMSLIALPLVWRLFEERATTLQKSPSCA